MRRIFLAPACATAIVLLLCSASALAARGHVCNNTFGTLGSGNGQLNDPQGVALNEATGRIYVVDKANNRVEYFSAAGAYEGQFNGSGAPQQFLEPQAIAVDNSLSSSKGNVYVADVGNRVVDKLGPGGEYIGQVSATKTALFNEIMGVAVNPSGELWVAFNYGASDYVSRFSSDLSKVNNEWKPRGGGFIKPAIAVDAQDNLYISREIGAGRIEKTNASGETLNPEVGGERDYYWPAVETSTGDSFLGQLDHVSVFSPEGVPIEHLGQGRLTVAAGIAVNSASGTVYIADSSADGVVVCPFEPPGPPTIESDSVSEVSATGATFGGELNPRSLGGEPATEYAFEYGSCPTIEQCPASPYEELALESLAASFEVSSVGVRLQVLQPDTAYHVRLVARNSHSPGQGFVVGSEVTFTTQRVGGPLALPDGRSWELVTPPDAHGAALFPIGGEGLVQAASDGSGIAYLASYPVEPGAQGFAVLAQVLARRGAAGWSSTDVMVSHDTPTGVTVGNGHEYRFFSEDLAAAIVEPLGPFSPPMSEGLLEASPEPTERTPYLRHDTTCQTTPATCYEPLVVGGEEGDVSPSGTKFGGSAATSVVGLAKFAGATPDAAHVIVSSSVGLTEHPSAPGGGLYGWSAASPGGERLGLVSVLPKEEGGQAAPVYELGGGSVARHAISNDGSRVVFTARPPGEGPHLYVRDMVKRQTIRLDVPEAGMPAGAEGVFQTASVDGSKVFFTNVSSLVKGAGLDDLYECELVEVEQAAENKLKCVLSDLTPIPAAGQPGAGQPAEVQGVLGASEDGGYVYFVANGVQAPGATPGNCAGTSTPKEGETCNLYVRHAGATSFIATLSQEDSPDWTAETSREASRVSPDGEWLAFMSDRSLTGYDNRDAKSGRPDEEVFLYNAPSGRLACASCNPTGSRPVGVEYKNIDEGLAGGNRVWPEGQWVAANIPGWTPYINGTALYQSRYLSDTGRLFFNSSDALVPQDTNGDEDVYEYEPTGTGPVTGGCSEAAGTFVPAARGCVGLISSGVASGESAFLDASTTGGDVFFLTGEKLVPQDTGSGLDIYDAHECTSVAPCPSPVAVPSVCESAGSCRTAPMSQPVIYGAPASMTFNGTGNQSTGQAAVKPRSLTRAAKLVRALKQCKHKRGRARTACERQARRRYGRVSSRGARKGGVAR